MDKISTFAGQAEEAATFYTALLPDSRIIERTSSPIAYPAPSPSRSVAAVSSP